MGRIGVVRFPRIGFVRVPAHSDAGRRRSGPPASDRLPADRGRSDVALPEGSELALGLRDDPARCAGTGNRSLTSGRRRRAG